MPHELRPLQSMNVIRISDKAVHESLKFFAPELIDYLGRISQAQSHRSLHEDPTTVKRRPNEPWARFHT